MKNIILLVLILNSFLFGLSNCQTKYEYKDANITTITKTVADFISYNTSPIDLEASIYWLYLSTGNSEVTGISDSIQFSTTYCGKGNVSDGSFKKCVGYNYSSCGSASTPPKIVQNSAGEYCKRIEYSNYLEWCAGSGNDGSWGKYECSPYYDSKGIAKTTYNVSSSYSKNIGRYDCTSNQYAGMKEWFTKNYDGTCISVSNPSNCNYNAVMEKEITLLNCPSEHPIKVDSTTCKSTIDYNYDEYKCDENDLNTQGKGWEYQTQLLNDGVKIDPDRLIDNSQILSSLVTSHTSSINLCKRQYQECTIDCQLPLTLNTSTGKCEMDYETACSDRNMTYNSSTKKCDEINQCGNPLAVMDANSNFCTLPVSCTNVVNGECTEDSVKYCEDGNFTYNGETNLCEKNINCSSNQILLPNGKCGSVPYCSNGDTQTNEKCIHATTVLKTCAPYDRDANLCFATQTGPDNFNIDTFRDLIKVDLNGTFKAEEYGNIKNTYCSNDDGNCTFRLTEITTENNGKDICFKDNVGSKNCITIEGNCNLSGSIKSSLGIRQLRIENGYNIVGYNKKISSNSIGSIQSTCSLSGKVGHEDSDSLNREIIAASSNGIDIIFWDSYKRGNIGIITFLPTIPQKDTNDGYTYQEPEIMKLYNSNFTAFYSINNATYSVYNGLISKNDCMSKISGTSFFIAQGQTNDEVNILNMLSLVGNDKYNYNDGNEINGSCVVKSNLVKSFNEQEYSIKRVNVSNAQTKYMCSPLKCNNHTCQYNQCPENFRGDIYNRDDVNSFMQDNYPNININNLCTEDTCDSNLPYYNYCGNANGCSSKLGVYQQEDGTCVKTSCKDDEQFDIQSGKCKKLGCKNSVEKDGKCLKTLEL